MPGKTVVILGGGAGGLVTAHHLARKKDGHRIVLVERDPVYQLLFSKLRVCLHNTSFECVNLA